MAREALFRRSIHAVDEHSGLASILSSVFTPTAEPHEEGVCSERPQCILCGVLMQANAVPLDTSFPEREAFHDETFT